MPSGAPNQGIRSQSFTTLSTTGRSARGRTRTDTSLRTADFKSAASTIPPLGHNKRNQDLVIPVDIRLSIKSNSTIMTPNFDNSCLLSRDFDTLTEYDVSQLLSFRSCHTAKRDNTMFVPYRSRLTYNFTQSCRCSRNIKFSSLIALSRCSRMVLLLCISLALSSIKVKWTRSNIAFHLFRPACLGRVGILSTILRLSLQCVPLLLGPALILGAIFHSRMSL